MDYSEMLARLQIATRAMSTRPLTWDADEVQELIIRATRQFGDHELDDSQPSRMYWAPATAAACALIVLVTLRLFGDLAT